MKDADRELDAMASARVIQDKCGVVDVGKTRIGLILGTGWGDALEIQDSKELSFNDIPGFESLGELEGHARRLVYGKITGKEVLALRGRVHLNEGHGEEIPRMVRLQTEMLFQLGVNKLVITSAVGSLDSGLPVGSVAIIRSFITLFAPPMPLWAGEFVSPEDMLDQKLNLLAIKSCKEVGLSSKLAVHSMVRGPFFEGRKKDKGLLKKFGADVVGMSMLPEACVAAVYGVKILGLGFVTNNATDEHSHEENQAIVKRSESKLGSLLTSLVEHTK